MHAGLNKGEARNALARAVFFNRLGEIRDRSFEQQRYRASGLNLVTAAIVLWNTVYLERAAHALRGNGHAVDDSQQGLSSRAICPTCSPAPSTVWPWRRRRAWPDEGTRGCAGQDGYDRVRTSAAKYRYRSEIGLRAAPRARHAVLPQG